MIHRGIRVADGAVVAGIALSSGNDMIGRLAERDRAIVAGRAWCVRLKVVNETEVAVRCSEMAALTEIRRLRMRLRLTLCIRAIMAGKALLRRSLEASIDMARCTLDADMGAGERIAGREMIEPCRQRGLRITRHGRQQEGCDNHQQSQT